MFFSAGGRRASSDVVNRSRLLFALVFVALTHWLLEGTPFPRQVEAFRWGWLALSSVLGLVLGDASLFEAYVLLGPRLAMLMMSLVPIVTTVAGWFLFGETISSVEGAGICLTVAGIAWVVTDRRNAAVVPSRQYRRGLLFGLGGALGQAANLLTAKYALVGDFPAISASLIRIFVAVVVLWTLAGVQRKARKIVATWRRQDVLRLILAGTFVGPFLGIWFSLIAVQNARIGIATTLMALPPVILIPLTVLIYRESVSRRAFIGTLIAFGGVALIFA
jgi:drug/metabolite transporter (DMT)-like permease